MSWSKLVNTKMANVVQDRMDNPDLEYHVFAHLLRLYEIAEAWDLPYDPDLDCAILFHDSVYDSLPDKEVRSIVFMNEVAQSHPDWFIGINLDNVKDMIATTIDHEIVANGNNLLLKLDLADLGNTNIARKNFWKIMHESMKLYNIDIATAAKGTYDFMTAFEHTINKNKIACLADDTFEPDTTFWVNVEFGVVRTKIMSETIVDLYAQGYAT